jgi:gliding motility-associated-like protein
MNTTDFKMQSIIGKSFSILFFLFFLNIHFLDAQTFPNPASLSTGQGTPGSIDPLWLASPWYASNPPNPMGLPYISTLINNNCAPGAWVDPASLPAPVNNGNWITGSDDDCATNTNSGFRYFRLPLNLPADCNGFSVTVAGNYVLNLIGYSDNTITDVFVNGTSTGISGGNFAAGGQLEIELVGPWVVGLNYVDVLVNNFPGANPGDANPYGLLLVADATQDSQLDTDNDGISNLDDVCPCEAGTNPFGCSDPTLYNCDMDAIRQAFTDAGCIEMPGCSSDCSVYFLNPQQMTGSQAQTFAQNLGANLVSIQSQDENDCILSSLGNLGQTGVIWIGFSDEASEGNFVWYDQSSVGYTNWAPGEPNQSGDEDCVQIYPTGASPGTWNDLSCNSANSRSIIEVNLCPVIDAGSPVSLCIGESTTLTASTTLFGSAPYTYSWDTGTNAQTTTVSPTVTSEYTITTVDRYGCTNSDSVDVTINLLPIVNGGNDVTVCPQQNATLSGSGAVSYTWNNDVINNTPFIPYLSNAAYIVTGTDANGCQNTDTVNVFVQLNGCANFPNDFTCDIDSIRAAFAAAGCTEMISCVSPCSMYFLNEQSMSGSQAQTFAQTLGANLVSIQSQGENDCIVSSLVNLGLNSINDVIWIGFNDEAQEGTFGWYDQSTVSFTNWNTGEPNDAGGNEDCTQIYPDGFWNDLPCNSSNARSVIEVNLCPVINAGSDQLICLNDAATLQASATLSGSSPYTYTWNDGTIGQTNTVSPTSATNYSIATVDRYGCTDSDTVLVTVAPLPTADFTFVQGCFGEPVIFTNTSTIVAPETITTANWNFGDGSAPVSSTNTQHIFTTPGTFTVNLTVSSANGCSDSETQTLTVNPVPTGTQNESICEGESFTFGGNTYSTPGSYTATFQNAAGCDSIVTLVLAQFATPEDPIITSNSPLECPDDQLILSINSVNGASYAWSGPNGFSSSEQTISFPAGLSDAGVYTAVISVNGCPSEPSSTAVLILGKNELSIADFPNVITPNGDGINDVYDLNTAFTSCLPYQLSVFNRWGNLVYEQTFETSPFAGLDQAGTKLAAGVYFYKLTYGEFEKSGFISVLQD